MKKSILALVATLAVLAACGPSQTPEQRAQSKAKTDRINAIWRTAETVDVNGNSYKIAVSPDRTFALMAPVKTGFDYTAADLEALARAKTGCRADFSAGILGAIGGYSDEVDLRHLQSISTNFRFWRADLKC